MGKTALARHTLGCLANQADIGCLGATPAMILWTVCEALGANPPRNASTDDLQARLVDVIERPTVVILNKADEDQSSATRSANFSRTFCIFGRICT